MPLLDVPVIDIGAARSGDSAAQAALAATIDRACRDIGFLVISGHGVMPELVDRTHDMARAFFDLPMPDKMRVRQPAPDVTRFYTPLAGESVARSRDPKATVGDLNESFMIGPVDPVDVAYATAPEAGRHFAPNLWPDQPRGMQETLA